MNSNEFLSYLWILGASSTVGMYAWAALPWLMPWTTAHKAIVGASITAAIALIAPQAIDASTDRSPKFDPEIGDIPLQPLPRGSEVTVVTISGSTDPWDGALEPPKEGPMDPSHPLACQSICARLLAAGWPKVKTKHVAKTSTGDYIPPYALAWSILPPNDDGRGRPSQTWPIAKDASGDERRALTAVHLPRPEDFLTGDYVIVTGTYSDGAHAIEKIVEIQVSGDEGVAIGRIATATYQPVSRPLQLIAYDNEDNKRRLRPKRDQIPPGRIDRLKAEALITGGDLP